MTPEQKIKFANESTRWQLSAILHGEQGALALSASLCHILRDPGALGIRRQPDPRRGAARHRLLQLHQARWGTPLPCGATPANPADRDGRAPEVYKEDRRMQMPRSRASPWAPSHCSNQNSQDPLLGQALQWS